MKTPEPPLNESVLFLGYLLYIEQMNDDDNVENYCALIENAMI